MISPITKKPYFIKLEGERVEITENNAKELGVEDKFNLHLAAQTPTEREWRNYELTNTDWMLVPDATYAGELLAGSQKLTDIMDYRTRLREYNLTTDDRPSRPEWFNG